MNVPILYCYLQLKIAEHSSNGRINIEKVKDLFSKYKIPKNLKDKVLEEMRDFGLLRIERKSYNSIIFIMGENYKEEYNSMDRLTRRRNFEKVILK